MISVIVPFKNSEQWLRRCLESLQIQTGDLEFIVVNDSSDDNGREIAEEFAEADNRFRLFDNERRAGVSGARNTGLDHAAGEWVTFVDSDDELLADASEVFDRMIDLKANIIQANHLRQYPGKSRLVEKYSNDRGVYGFERMPQCWCMVWNKLYRRSVYGQVRFVEGFQFGEDEIFNLDCFAIDDRIRHTKRGTVTLLRHFENKGSLSHIMARAELMRQAEELMAYVERTDNVRARLFACKVLSEHWGSPTYEKVFGNA